ncbi:MAG: ADP-forming succinate--CoA ligase subunit beta [Mariprofundales bacterium]
MYIHEYQAKSLLEQAGIAIPQGIIAHNVDEAEQACAALGGSCVVKAQIHAGGRGKAGGVRVCNDINTCRTAARTILDQPLITAQTSKQGKVVRTLLIEQTLDIEHEYYLSILLDRTKDSVCFMVSPAGGMDIEHVAATQADKIMHVSINFITGLQAHHSRRMGRFLELSGESLRDFTKLVTALYAAFFRYDATLIEMNPLVLTKDKKLYALDAKISIDDNALYRQNTIAHMRDAHEEDARETEARQFGLNYIQLNGDIGCMVNGAGLAMATMDIITLKGASPANFLDVGGGVSEKAVEEAFLLLFANNALKAILVNIFGGIVRCDIIAQGLLNAAAKKSIAAARIPIILRLVGTREEEGRKLIADATIAVHWANDLDEAASLAVSLA